MNRNMRRRRQRFWGRSDLGGFGGTKGAVNFLFAGRRVGNHRLDKHCTIRYDVIMLSKELVAASTVPLVLSVLTESENYGYALIQRVRELSDGRVEWTEGMLYPVLHWMEKEGLIESEWREADTGRKRKYYRLSRKGHNALRQEREQWMTIHETLTKLWQLQSHSI